MHFEREFELPLTAEAVWQVLWDVQRMMACVPGCTDAIAVEDGRRYQATILEKVGPFKVEIPLDIEILTVDVGRGIRLRATGKDSRIGTEVAFVLAVELEPQGQRTQFRMAVDATVVGRLVSLGQAVIKLKGNQQMGRFAEALQADLIGALPADSHS